MSCPLSCCPNGRWFPRYPLHSFMFWFTTARGHHCLPIFTDRVSVLRHNWRWTIEVWQTTLKHPDHVLCLRGAYVLRQSPERCSGHRQPCVIKGERLVLILTDCMWGFWFLVMKQGLWMAGRTRPVWGAGTSCPLAWKVSLTFPPTAVTGMFITETRDLCWKGE